MQRIGLRSFGLPFAFDPTPWYAFDVGGHCLNPPAHIGPPRQRRAKLFPSFPLDQFHLGIPLRWECVEICDHPAHQCQLLG